MPGVRSRLLPVLQQRLDAFSAHLPGARDGRVRAVHQARVASRRLREVLPVVGASAGHHDVRRAVRRARRLTRALGPVREMDVALGLLTQLEQAHPDLAAPIDATRRRVVQERETRRAALLEALAEPEVAHTLAAVARVQAAIVADDPAWREVLVARLRRRAVALETAISSAGVLYAADALHAVRIASKKLRYALEVAGEVGAAPVARTVSTLRNVQDLLGELHDLEVLADLAIGTVAQGHVPTLASEDGRFAALLHEECRRLHGSYLAGRDRLLEVTHRVRDRLVPVVGRARRRSAAATPRPAAIARAS